MDLNLARIGLEAGPLSQWLCAAMKEAGLAVELLDTRHVSDAFKSMLVKTDRKDARGIAQLMRLGWFKPVHCKSMAAQATRCREKQNVVDCCADRGVFIRSGVVDLPREPTSASLLARAVLAARALREVISRLETSKLIAPIWMFIEKVL